MIINIFIISVDNVFVKVNFWNSWFMLFCFENRLRVNKKIKIEIIEKKVRIIFLLLLLKYIKFLLDRV